jgi:hypothetical protein
MSTLPFTADSRLASASVRVFRWISPALALADRRAALRVSRLVVLPMPFDAFSESSAPEPDATNLVWPSPLSMIAPSEATPPAVTMIEGAFEAAA